MVVIGLHGYGGHGEVGTVDGNHSGLRKASLRVVFLDHGVHRDGRNYEQDDKIYLGSG